MNVPPEAGVPRIVYVACRPRGIREGFVRVDVVSLAVKIAPQLGVLGVEHIPLEKEISFAFGEDVHGPVERSDPDGIGAMILIWLQLSDRLRPFRAVAPLTVFT